MPLAFGLCRPRAFSQRVSSHVGHESCPCRQDLADYIAVTESYGAPVDEKIAFDAKASIARAQATECEGVLAHVFSTQSDKMLLRKHCLAQNKELAQISGGSDMIHPLLAKRMADALIFK